MEKTSNSKLFEEIDLFKPVLKLKIQRNNVHLFQSPKK